MSAGFGHSEKETPPESPVEPAAESTAKPRRPRGFAAMDRKLVSEIARKGGKAAHSAGTAHEFTTDEARVAGRKGGRATHAKRRGEPPALSAEAGAEAGALTGALAGESDRVSSAGPRDRR